VASSREILSKESLPHELCLKAFVARSEKAASSAHQGDSPGSGFEPMIKNFSYFQRKTPYDQEEALIFLIGCSLAMY
jgi:hypothetical protein